MDNINSRNGYTSPVLYPFIVFTLLSLIPLFTITSMLQKSVTFDEVAHLPSGYSYIVERDYRMNPEHPPLIKMVSAIPLLFLDLKRPASYPEWDMDNKRLAQWRMGKRFIYNNIKDADTIIFWGRIPMVFLSVILGFFVFLWAKKIYGVKSGLFALLLYVIEPNILAHSRLVNTDIGITLFLFLTFFSFWNLFQNPNLSYIFLLSISTGLAFATKFSAVTLLPIMGSLFAIQLFVKNERFEEYLTSYRTRGSPFFKKLIFLSLLTIIIIIVSLFIIGAVYQFKHISRFFDGLNNVLTHSKQGHPNYLFGESSMKGWWYYFPVTFILKTPIPIIIFLIIAIIISFKKKREEIINELPLILPPLIYLFISLFSHMNVGVRHILPVYPFIFVYVSSMISPSQYLFILKGKIPGRAFMVCILLLLSWYIYSSLKIYPDYLAYFNEFTGGPDNGYLYLADSNIDWGQDLKGLKRYMDENDINEIILSYFGTAEPDHYKIRYQRLYPYIGPSKGYLLRSKEKEILAVSVNSLVGIGFPNKQYFSWLQDMKPIAKIGYSIFIYDITNNPVAHFSIGYNSIDAGLYDEAIREFNRVLELNPDLAAQAHTGLSLAYYHKKKEDSRK